MNLYEFSDLSGRRVVFRVHAVQRMSERRISVSDVLHVLGSGMTIKDYPTDRPYPSRPVLGWCESRPVHVVVAENQSNNELIVITVYEPGPGLRNSEHARRDE